MNSDIRVSICFRNHRKRKRLRRKLGDRYLDYLIDFWIGVSLHKPAGELAGWGIEDIADEAGWLGDPALFVEAMIEVGFLDLHGDVYYCHDWEKWQGWVCGADARTEKARLAARARWDKKNGVDATSNATSMDIGHATSNAPSPTPSPSPKLITSQDSELSIGEDNPFD